MLYEIRYNCRILSFNRIKVQSMPGSMQSNLCVECSPQAIVGKLRALSLSCRRRHRCCSLLRKYRIRRKSALRKWILLMTIVHPDDRIKAKSEESEEISNSRLRMIKSKWSVRCHWVRLDGHGLICFDCEFQKWMRCICVHRREGKRKQWDRQFMAGTRARAHHEQCRAAYGVGGWMTRHIVRVLGHVFVSLDEERVRRDIRYIIVITWRGCKFNSILLNAQIFPSRGGSRAEKKWVKIRVDWKAVAFVSGVALVNGISAFRRRIIVNARRVEGNREFCWLGHIG